MDIEESVKYFATHSFIIQMDNMFTWKQNYGLYIDKNGKSLMVPWDYDLSWGYGNAPADGESVANWNIDKLYNDVAGTNAYFNDLDRFYKDYPLFNVIYQNQSLREKMHTYMEDCARLVTLGGTTSDGKKYEAGRFAKDIASLYNKVVAAASETLAENGYYLNATQPDDCKVGMKGLSQIIGLRSVGAYIQLKNIDAKVTGYSYPTGCLGLDAETATYTTYGDKIACVDSNSGIFVIGNYKKVDGKGPKLTVNELSSQDSTYNEIKSKLDTNDAKKEMKIYNIKNEISEKDDAKVYLPLLPQYASDGAIIYTYKDGELRQEDVGKDDNIYSFTTDDYSYVILLKNQVEDTNQTEENQVNENQPDDKQQINDEKVVSNEGTNKTSEKDEQSKNTTSTSVAKSKSLKLAKVKITSVKKKKKKIILKWKKVKNAKGYQIQYALNKKFTKKKKTKNTKKKTITIKKLKRKKTYFIRVRAFVKVGTRKTYGKWSKIKRVKIK